MNNHRRIDDDYELPEFLRISIEKGIIDTAAARRIELYRRTRGLADHEFVSFLAKVKPDPTLTFESFVPCRGNSFALELAKTVVTNSPTNLPYNPLYIYGDVGVGKTHILSSIANAAADRPTILLNMADLDVELERAKRANTRAELREWLIAPDILLLDDIQLCIANEELQVEVFSALNHITRAARWVVISSDVPPTHLAGMESRLMSRLGGGVIVGLQTGEKADRVALLRHFDKDGRIPDEVLDYLAGNISGSVRMLKAAVSQLLAASGGTGVPITLDLAHAVLIPEESEPPGPRHIRSTGRAEAAGIEREEATRKAVARFKEMLAGAETEEEQALALQIALGERIRQLRQDRADSTAVERFERALELLRKGDIEVAIQCLGE